VALGVDTNLFTPPVARVEGPPWRLIHVASLNRIKDQPLLLNAMRRLIDTGVDAHLDIVGEDTLNGAMQQLATTLGLQSNVTFCGFKPSNELVPMYQRSHLALLTSRHEAAGVVTLEAAACGLVTLGTKVGYVADFDGTRSIAVAPADPARLADAIAAALVDRPRRLQFGANAREWAVAHNADWTANRLEEIYQEIAHR
jgi:glycosyltransferase involved in cell wall biosynthesis